MLGSVVVQKYVERPLAPGGQKMDLRVWVLILRWQPMLAFMFEEPYARLAAKSLTYDLDSVQDPMVHLTNASQHQKHTHFPKTEDEPYRWTLSKLLGWLSGPGGFAEDAWRAQVWPRMVALMRRFLDAAELIPDKFEPCYRGYIQSFELFGVDMLLDEGMNPWLLEANCSPSLCTDAGPTLRQMVRRALQGALALVLRTHKEGDGWLPSPLAVEASASGLPLNDEDGWLLMMHKGQLRAPGPARRLSTDS